MIASTRRKGDPAQPSRGKRGTAEKTGRLIGYARLSRDGGEEEQVAALEQAGCDEIFQDHPNAITSDARPALDAAVASLKQGDTLVVWRLDRLGHSLPQLVQTMKNLAASGIEFRSLSEQIDTASPGGRAVYHVMEALVDCERALISERTRAGMQAAQEKGQTLGRRPALSAVQRQEVFEAVRKLGESIEDVALRYNVHSRTIRRVLSAAEKDMPTGSRQRRPVAAVPSRSGQRRRKAG